MRDSSVNLFHIFNIFPIYFSSWQTIEYSIKMVICTLFCLASLVPAPSLGEIRLVNMTTNQIHIIGAVKTEILNVLYCVWIYILMIDTDNSSMEKEKFRISIGVLLPGSQHTTGECRYQNSQRSKNKANFSFYSNLIKLSKDPTCLLLFLYRNSHFLCRTVKLWSSLEESYYKVEPRPVTYFIWIPQF